MNLIGVTAVAKQVGKSAAYIRRLCITHNIGRKLTSNARLLTPSEVARIAKLLGK